MLRPGSRTYRGTAGIIRRRTIIVISTALALAAVMLLLGSIFQKREFLAGVDYFSLSVLAALAGLIAGSLVLLRWSNRTLRAIEHIEDSLLRLTESKNLLLIKEQLDHSGSSDKALPLAFDALLDHFNRIETDRLDFLARIAHDIRSPLGTIINCADLLSDPEFHKDDQFLEYSLGLIKKGVSQINQLAEDSVLAAEIDSGSYQPTRSTFQLGQLLKSLVEDTRNKSKREITFNNDAGEVQLYSDAIGIREAVLRLLDNSFKYSSPASPVTLSLQPSDEPGFIEIKVHDDGIGINEQDQLGLFRRFSRIRNHQTQGVPGSGLGLYIIKNIVELNQGLVSVDSKPNQGSTFTLRLPVDLKTAGSIQP